MLLPHFVPCQQDVIGVRFFACSSRVRAYRTALACKGSMCRCSAMRRPTCFGLVCTCRFHECGGIGQCVLLHSVCNSTCTIEGRIATRALHQSTNVQRRSALHIAPATLVARLAPVESLHSWSHCGWFVVHERRRLRPLTLRCVCNSACDGRIAAPVYMPLQLNARGNHRSASASACYHALRLYDVLRRSELKFVGRRFHERSLRAVDTNRSWARK